MLDKVKESEEQIKEWEDIYDFLHPKIQKKLNTYEVSNLFTHSPDFLKQELIEKDVTIKALRDKDAKSSLRKDNKNLRAANKNKDQLISKLVSENYDLKRSLGLTKGGNNNAPMA